FRLSEMTQQYEFQKCNICGSVKLQYLSTNENKMICCICNNLDPRDKNLVNANLFRPSNNKLYPWDCRLDSQIPKPVITSLTPFAASAKPGLRCINEAEQERIIAAKNIEIK